MAINTSRSQVPTQEIAMMIRGKRRRLRDLRVWLGLALILGSMFLGAFVLSSGNQTNNVWRATRDLAVGSVPEVESVTLALGDAASTYLSTAQFPQGRMKFPVAIGGLIPVNAVGAALPAATRLVTIPVDPMRAPVSITAGDVVDVWVSAPKANNGVPPIPTLVLSNIRVAEVDRDLSGVGGEIPVVLDVVDSQTAQLIGATRGELSLVLVPLNSQSFYGEVG
ncbi:MAG: hypothetical protein WCK04_02405 [Actinomycetes bacterium]